MFSQTKCFSIFVNKLILLIPLALISNHILANVSAFDVNATYATPNTIVRYHTPDGDGGYYVAHFKNKWHTTGATKPTFYSSNGPWQRITQVVFASKRPTTEAISGNSVTVKWNENGTYVGSYVVKHDTLCYKAKWWTTSEPVAGGSTTWEAMTSCPAPKPVTLAAVSSGSDTTSYINPTTKVTDSKSTISSEVCPVGTEAYKETGAPSDIPLWNEDAVYTDGSIVYQKYDDTYYFYKAKWWNKGSTSTDTGVAPGKAEPNPPWNSPWKWYFDCAPNLEATGVAQVAVRGDETALGDVSSSTKVPYTILQDDSDVKAAQAATDQAGENTQTTFTPVVPPVIPAEVPTSTAASGTVATELPDDGYEFLRLVTTDDWDWMFPLRSGKSVATEPCTTRQFLNCGGGTRNSDAYPDTFTLDNFKKAVLAYNHWANLNGYKQFLNEGTLKQQAQEFIVFWAKSSRETSGSWSSANEPWIVNHILAGENITAWKGGLYWVEEVGYTTDSTTGKSTAINYVDSGSSLYPPSAGRSYYGRGIIQLSWNYNYGAFSYWLYDNNLLRDVVDTRNKLLDYPNLVAENGALSIMSGIWFWMTPQGAKPSSHDVMYGDVYNISQTTQDLGLPQTNDSSYTPPVASGDTSHPETYAYRVGTVINIVNGGLECNKAAKWHGGPVQRVLYYDAYAAYFNATHSVNATRLGGAGTASNKAAWLSKVSSTSEQALQNSTCYNQKSYYGW